MPVETREIDYMQTGDTRNAASRHAGPIQPSTVNSRPPVFHLFESAQPMSLPERFPRLTCVAIACCLLLTALVGEIDCLRDSGYYWR